MKIILSRKGFDSANGSCPSPIMPDGTLLSLPIPLKNGKDGDKTYADLSYNGRPYNELIKQFYSEKNNQYCHIDPDIRKDAFSTIQDGWRPAFGQVDSAQGYLSNQGVDENDLFLFFGWFRQVEEMDGSFHYKSNEPDLHIIYGYLQVKKVLKNWEEIKDYGHHPHADRTRYEKNKSNALYIPRDTLSFDNTKPGYGVLNFSDDRVLTLPGHSRGIWKNLPMLCPSNLTKERKNCANGAGIYYRGIWQELVLKENEETEMWAKEILQS